MTLDLLRKALHGLRKRRLRRAIIRDLSALDDRLLRDIGIERRDIRAVAEGVSRTAQPPAAETAPREPGVCDAELGLRPAA